MNCETNFMSLCKLISLQAYKHANSAISCMKNDSLPIREDAILCEPLLCGVNVNVIAAAIYVYHEERHIIIHTF